MLTPVALIAGTWGRSGLPASVPGSYYWWKPPSVFIANLKNAGLWLVSDKDYFEWSTALDGVEGPNSDWSTAGKALYWYWVAHGREAISFVAHSHGAQIVAYALNHAHELGEQMFVEHLVTVGSPVRADLQPIWNAICPMIHDWTHLYCDEVVNLIDGDLGFQELGSRPLDTTFGFKREMPQATRNIEIVPAVTHHGLIAAKLWNDHNLWQYLQS